jgi:hypothetical protein
MFVYTGQVFFVLYDLEAHNYSKFEETGALARGI